VELWIEGISPHLEEPCLWWSNAIVRRLIIMTIMKQPIPKHCQLSTPRGIFGYVCATAIYVRNPIPTFASVLWQKQAMANTMALSLASYIAWAVFFSVLFCKQQSSEWTPWTQQNRWIVCRQYLNWKNCSENWLPTRVPNSSS
jgi:hypothetical protein